MPHLRRSLLSSLGPFAAVFTTICVLNTSPTVPRFEQPELNYVAVIVLAIALPATLFWFAFTRLTGIWRWIVVALGIVLSFLVLVVSVLVAQDLLQFAGSGVDPDFERIADLGTSPVAYRLYRTDGGATNAFGIVLRKERAVLPGLKLVTDVRSFYPAEKAAFEQLDSGHATVRVEAYGERQRGEVYEFTL